MGDKAQPKNPLGAFTAHGRILVVVCLLTLPAGFYLTVEWGIFEPGFYPIIVLALPAIAVALSLFIVGCLTFRCIGLKILTPGNSDDDSKAGNTNGGTSTRD